MDDEAVLVVSDKGLAHVIDARSGATLRVVKDCHPAGAAGLSASPRFLLAAERERSFVHMWSWAKEQPRYRCQAPERLGCLVCTSDGAHCVAGGVSGTLYLWQVATGKLLLSWDGHFKAVTALACASSDGFLLSAGDDAIILAWRFAELLHAALAGQPPPPPWRTWSDHTLPISALCVAPCGQHDLVASASADQTVRLWRLSEYARGCIHWADLPAALTSLAIHPAHTAVYAGGADGRLHAVPLLTTAAELHAGSGIGRPAARSAAHAAGPAALVSSGAHGGAVRSVCASIDGLRLLSCAGEAGVRVWDAHSLTLLMQLQPTLHAAALVLFYPPRPAHAATAADDGAAAGGAAAAPPPLMAPLKKFAELAGVGPPSPPPPPATPRQPPPPFPQLWDKTLLPRLPQATALTTPTPAAARCRARA